MSERPNFDDLLQGRVSARFDVLKTTLEIARHRAARLPQPLSWVEPSINMPHLQACYSFLLGSSLGCILILGALLEHTLRIAIIDKLKGYQGAMEKALWDKYRYFSVGDLLKGYRGNDKKNLDTALVAAAKAIVPAADLAWWQDVVDRIRNKVAHLDYPEMITDIGKDERYMGLYVNAYRREWAYQSRGEWGFTYHRFDDSVAETFLKDATEKLRTVISAMPWNPDTSHWISQKWEYDSFFAYDWSRAGLKTQSSAPSTATPSS